MKNTDPGKMTSDIARTACRNYKEDPKVVDEVKDWIIYKYGEQMKEEVAEKVAAEVAEKEKALRKEYEEKLEEKLKERLKGQKKESEDALRKQQVQIAKNLLSLSSMTISEIAAATKLEESEVKKISKE